MVSTASTQDIERWKAAGGTVEQATRGKTFISSSGEKMKTWKEAEKLLASAEGNAQEVAVPAKVDKGSKRGKENAAAEESGKKKSRAEPQPKAQSGTPKNSEDAAAVKKADETAKKADGKTKKAAVAAKDAKEVVEVEAKVEVEVEVKEEAPAKKKAKVVAAKKLPAGKAKAAASAAASADEEPAADSDSNMEEANTAADGTADAADPADATAGNGGIVRRAAAQVKGSYKESGKVRERRDDKIYSAEEAVCISEADALEQTGGKSAGIKRRLLDFTIEDAEGQAIAVERIHLMKADVFISGLIYPSDGELSKMKDAGRRAIKFGPVKEWKVLYSSAGAQVVIKTPHALYDLSKASSSYRKIFTQLEEQVEICSQIYLALSPSVGGTFTASYDEVVAKLARSKVGKTYGTTRDALLLSAKFVQSQLTAMTAQQTGASSKTALSFQDSAFGLGLAEEASKNAYTMGVMSNGSGIRIVDSSDDAAAAEPVAPVDPMMEADEEMARRMQARLDAEQHGGGGRGRGGKAQVAPYIRISEEEIADDYPMPMQYNKEEEETDELLMMDDELLDADPEYLPKRLLHNFAIYNAEGFFSALELVPMFSGSDHDIDMFASGVVTEDEGDWCTGGQAMEDKSGSDGAGSSAAAGVGGSGSAAAAAGNTETTAPKGGMRLFLSQIREWVVECSCDLLFISIRTDVAWYRLVTPDAKYAPWFKTVLKAAQVAMKIISMLSEETRASKLSFNDVVKRLSEMTDSTAISMKADRVERFVVVHGQIILNQFKHFPNKAVQKAAFVTELKQRMETRKHSKLYLSKIKPMKGAAAKSRTANPMKARTAPGPKANPMPATATTMVKSVWHGYFFGAKAKLEEAEADGANGEAAVVAGAPLAQAVEDPDANEDEDEQEEAVVAAAVAASKAKGASQKKEKKAKAAAKPSWVGASSRTDTAGRMLYAAAKVGSIELKLGQVVVMDIDASDDDDVTNNETGAQAPMGLILALFQDKNGDKLAQVRHMIRGPDTILGDAGSECELFVSGTTAVVSLSDVVSVTTASRLVRPWQWDLRPAHFKEDDAFRKKNAELSAEGKPLQYTYKHFYRPELGMFCTIPDELMANDGAFHEAAADPISFGLIGDSGKDGFIKDGKEYKVGDFMYLHPNTFEAAKMGADDANIPAYARKGGKHKGSNAGLKAFCIAQLVAVQPAKGSAAPSSARIKVRRFVRPEDVSKDQAYISEWSDVYAPPTGQDAEGVDVEDVEGQCKVVLKSASRDKNDMDTFVCKGTVDSVTSPTKVISAPKSLKVSPSDSAAAAVPNAADLKAVAAKGKRPAKGRKLKKSEDSEESEEEVVEEVVKAPKAKAGKSKGQVAASAEEEEEAVEEEEEEEEEEGPSAVALKSLDIFAGCGGLSEGMHQAGVAESKWAIEYEQPAADAFKLNYPGAEVFCNNCNVLLHAAMEKAGFLDDCNASEDCMDASAKLTPETRAALPLPGQVDFMMGGPPCQGYSGMNRFNKGNWSLVQNSMVMAYLSYCDFYRPRYFLLENVRNFVSHNKSFTFRLTLRTLLEMGYQVRFGVLNAGLYGVPQSRKRTIIWAAAPGDSLPDWPAPIHVFQTPQLTINLPGDVQYTAVPNQVGAPRRAVTVKDAIADLPVIANGHDLESMPYDGPASSAFQRFIRGKNKVLKDHDCKSMNELNLERCRCIPKNQPGADWRVLQEIVKADPTRETFKGQPLVPWCLPNTADRHNGWRGLFGRLDLNGHFPTSTTDPQPMGKVGQVFHPTQDRIVSVRECARSQGFPDHFLFSGNVHSRHRQVGNAVPPPLAAALGRQLRKVLDAKREKEVKAALEQQFGF